MIHAASGSAAFPQIPMILPRAADALYIMIHRTHCAATQKCILPVAQEIEAFLVGNLTKHKHAFLVASAGIGRVVLTAKLFATQRSHANIVSSAARNTIDILLAPPFLSPIAFKDSLIF